MGEAKMVLAFLAPRKFAFFVTFLLCLRILCFFQEYYLERTYSAV